MVRLAVSDSPPLLNSGNNSSQAATQVITQSPNNSASGSINTSYVVHQTDTIVAPSTSSPVHNTTGQQIPQQALTIPPHHMPPPFHQTTNGGHMHDNGHHHNGGTLYLGAYANEFYPGAEAPHGTAYFIPELCPAHTQLCTAVHPEYGPVTVPMVSQSGSPPIPMPVQVPPGHVMQQIVDENGTLRHVILSTQHQQLQSGVQGVQHHIHGHFITANGTAPQYYNPIAGYPPTNQASSTNQLYTTMNHQQAQQLSHSPSPPNSTNNNNSNSSNNNNNSINNINYQNNERAQRQYNKLIRKLESRNTTSQVHSQASRINNRNDNLNGSSGTRRNNLQRNGTNSAGGASSVGTSDDGEESSSVPDEEDDMQILIDYLSSIEPPVVKEIQSHTALVTWEAPPQPTENALVNLNTNDIRYEILLGDRGKDGKYKSIFRGTNLSCRIQDLRAGQEYHVCLSAHLDDVKGSETEPVVFKTPAREPDTPTQPKVLAKTKSSLQLRWNAPVDNGSHIIHYVLEMSNEPDGEFTELCKIKGKQFTVNKLTPAAWYTFRLAAVNEVGRSEYSQPVSYNTDGYPPPQPLPPRVHNVTTTSIALLWSRRREDGEFILQMSNQGPQGYMNVYYGPELIYECTRLQRATSYQFRLASKTDAGQSTWSDEISVVTLPDQPGRPSKPQVKGKIHAYNFKVKWDPPHDRGGAEIKCYHLEISSGAVYERIYSGTLAEAVCDRLSPGTTYQVRVLCEGPGGVSGPSDTSTITTEAIVPNPPKTPYYSNLPGPYAAVLQWDKPHYQGGAPVIEYELELEGILNEGNADRKKQKTIVYRGKEPYCVVKDLLPGESYTTHVRAVNRIGAGEWSDEFSFRAGSAPPGKPLSPEVQVRSATNLLVKWQEPLCNGAPIIDYKLESSSKQEDDGFNIVYHGTEMSADLKDLLPFTTYFFRLHAVNASGRSPNSTTVSQRTPADVPGIPTLLPDLFAITSNTAHFFWKEPESNGDAINKYILECGDRQLETDKNQTDLLIEHLSPEQMYKIRVQAVNSIGAGAFCTSQKILTKPLPPKPPRLECIQHGYNSLKLKWGSGDGAPTSTMSKSANIMDFHRFYVEMKIKSSSKDFQNIYTGTRNSIKVQKLHESTDYAFRICAQTEHAGIGTWSEEYYYRTQAAQPNVVKILRCTENFPLINNNANESHIDILPTLTVEWQHSKNNHFNDSVEYILQKATSAVSNNKNLQYEEVYRGADTRFTETVEYDTDYSLRVIPVRVMKSKRTTSVCSSSTRNSHDSDEVDGRQSSDESDSDESDDEVKRRINDTPVTYEYVLGTASSAYHYRLPKSSEVHAVAANSTITTASSQSTNASRKVTKSSVSAKSSQSQVNVSKKHHHMQQSHKPSNVETELNSVDSSDDEKPAEVTSAKQSLFLNLLKAIREFFYNRNNWSVTQESIFIWLIFMIFAIIVGGILHFIMA
ncbi:hypothetical protein ACKWTF_001915 [Chironomus riparius]